MELQPFLPSSLSARESLAAFRTLTDRQVVTAFSTISLLQHASAARLVAIMAEFDERQLFRPLGFTSLFAYCTNRMGFSQDETFHRIRAARAVRRFPIILDYLEKGALNLTSVRLLTPHLTVENHVGLLETASRLKLPDVELLIARLKPRPDVPSTIRRLPPVVDRPRRTMSNAAATEAIPAATLASARPATVAGRPAPTTPIPAAMSTAAPVAATSAASASAPLFATEIAADNPVPQMPQATARELPSRRSMIQPLSEVSYRLQITLTKESHDTLRQIQGLIRHIVPTGDPAAIVARSLDLLLTDLRKRKAAQVTSPRTPGPDAARGRRIPAHVQRKVWTRDGGRCAFVSEDGRRCGADGFVEFHHVRPYARGGTATAANIELRCRTHNQYEAAIAGLKKRQRRGA